MLEKLIYYWDTHWNKLTCSTKGKKVAKYNSFAFEGGLSPVLLIIQPEDQIKFK